MAKRTIKTPFFEIGPKSYLYGDDILDLAKAADAASAKYGVDIIFTCPVVDIRRVAEATSHIHVFAPHMDPIYPGRGLADTLPESLVAAGATGVMLNHVEKPLSFDVLAETIKRADEVGLLSIVCADSMADASKIASLNPDIIVAEPTELIGTGVASDMGYVKDTIEAVRKINESGYLAILATNQPVIARGEVTFDQLREIHNKLETLLGQEGAYLDAIYFCPHHPHKGYEGEIPELKFDCECRKPKPGMLLQAAKDYHIDLSASYMVGDGEFDVQCGLNAGCKSVMITQDDVDVTHYASVLDFVNEVICKEN